MLAKAFRADRSKISYTLRKGETSSSRLFIIKSIENSTELPRFRTIVSKKILKEAVDRNHLRRQIYEAVRTIIKESPTKLLSKDYILVPKKNIITKNFKEIAKDLWENLINS